MRTTTTLFNIFALTLFSFGQMTGPENTEQYDRSQIVEPATQGWYSYAAQVIELGGSYSYYRNNLFPDSTVVVEFSNGFSPVWKHSMGQVFDPSSVYFDAVGTGHPSINDQTAYQVDSIGLWYRYFRHQDMTPDTLVIQVYEHDDINFSPDPGWSSGASYANVQYDYTVRKGANAMVEIEYLLTKDDTATDNQGFLNIPIGVHVDPGEKIAVTYTYFPGNPFNVGDTIDQYADIPPVNKINSLIVYEVKDESPYVEPEYYNNQIRATTDVRYNISTNGWNGDYIPGTAYASTSATTPSIYHLDMDFHVTTCDDIVSEYSSTDASCGGADGSVAISVTSGSAPYTYEWTSGNTTTNETGLAAGVHSVTITDSFGCSSVAKSIVSNNIAVNYSLSDALCNGDANGEIVLLPVGNNTPYTYAWSNNNVGSSASNLTAGSYIITTTDSLNCINIQEIEITEPAVLNAIATSISESVAGQTGSASVTASGGLLPYSYNWDGGEITATAVALPSGTVWVTVTDANGCISIDNISVPNTILEKDKNIDVNIFPNPTSIMLYISSDLNNLVSVKVFDSMGRILQQHTPNSKEIELDMTKHPSGLYFTNITTKYGTITRKIIVQ